MATRRWWYSGVAAAVVVAALVWAFAPRPIQVEAATVGLGRFETAIEEDGKTRLVDPYVVSAPLTGLVSRIDVREGDVLAAGGVVATMRAAQAPLFDDRTRRELRARLGAAQAQLQAAQAALERAGIARRRAEQDAARSAQLAQAGFVAASSAQADQLTALSVAKEVDAALAQRQQAQQDLEQARAALDVGAERGANGSRPVLLRAPVGGRVLRVLQTSEAVVALGTPLFELGDPGRLEVVAELLTADALLTRPGSAVRIDRWGGPAVQGRVRLVEPAGFTKISALGIEEQRVKVIIAIDSPAPDLAALGVGYRVNVRILTGAQDKVRKVPVSALFPLPQAGPDQAAAMAVYVIDGGRARLRPVRLGGSNAFEAWVQDGLAQGTQVIVYPPAAVHDGATINVRQVVRQP